MADEAPNPAPSGTPAEGTPNPAPVQSVKPDWAPDKFWNTEKNEVDVQTMALSYQDLSTRFAKGKEALKPEIEKEIFANRPESPDAYTVEMPKEGPLLERLSKSNLVITDKVPETQEEGKYYYIFDKQGPVWNLGKTLAYKAGLSNDQFLEIATAYAEAELGKTTAQRETFTKQMAEDRKVLGDDADKRIDFLKGKVQALIGSDGVKALDIDYMTSKEIQAVEALLEKTGQAKFAPEDAGQVSGGDDIAALEAEAQTLMSVWDYYQNNKTQERVRAIMERVTKAKKRK